MSSSSHSAQGAQPARSSAQGRPSAQEAHLAQGAQEAQPERRRDGKRRVAVAWGAQTLALFGVWMAFSGHTEIEFLLWGALAALAGTATTHWLFAGARESRYEHEARPVGAQARIALRAVPYALWLAWEIALSSLHVAYLVLRPGAPVAPSLVEFETSLRSESAQVLLAQSITLTPGTLTVDVSNGKFLAHCLSAKSRQGLEEGDIQRKVAWVFGESAPERVELRDVTTWEEVLP